MSRFFGPLRQLGMVFGNLDDGLSYWIARMGVGPFSVRHGVVLEDYRYRGRHEEAPVLSIARSFSGSLNIELIAQTNDAPSVYREFISAGREGSQHVAYWYDTSAKYDAAYAQALSLGMTATMEGALSGGGHRGRFAYFEYGADDPLMIEITEALIPPFDRMQAEAERRSAEWDGTDPIR